MTDLSPEIEEAVREAAHAVESPLWNGSLRPYRDLCRKVQEIERERCAKVVEGATFNRSSVVGPLLRSIAAAIREEPR